MVKGREQQYINHYHCTDCDVEWTDQWAGHPDDDCPECNATYTCDASQSEAVENEEDYVFIEDEEI